jgi:hypothetical protein
MISYILIMFLDSIQEHKVSGFNCGKYSLKINKASPYLCTTVYEVSISLLRIQYRLLYSGESRYTRFRYSPFRISALLFQYYDEHQYPIRGHGRSCRACPMSCARSCTDSPHHFDSGYYKLRPDMEYHSENSRAFIRLPFYAFSVYAAIRTTTHL